MKNKLKKIIISGISFIMLSSTSAFVSNTTKVNASQPDNSELIPGTINNHYPYGYVAKWSKDGTKIIGKKRILLPNSLRRKGTHIKVIKSSAVSPTASKVLRGYNNIYIAPNVYDHAKGKAYKLDLSMGSDWINIKDMNIKSHHQRIRKHNKKTYKNKVIKEARAYIRRNNKKINYLKALNRKEYRIIKANR